MRIVKRAFDFAASALAVLCAVLMVGSMVAMGVSVFMQVCLRTLLDTTWLPLDDLVVYGFTIIVFSGTALVFRANAHLATPVFLDMLQGRARYACGLAIDLLCLAFLAVMLVEGITYTADGMHQFSPLLHVPVGYIFASIPLAGLAGIVFILQRRLDDLLPRRPAQEDSVP